MKRTAYTIVELVIAMTIGMIVLAIGIPRYNRNIQRQEFTDKASVLQECIRKAQEGARVSASKTSFTGSDVRYSVAYITTEEKSVETDMLTHYYPVSVQCRNYLLPGSFTLKSLVIDDSETSPDVAVYNTGDLSLFWLTNDTIPDIDNPHVLRPIISLRYSSSNKSYPGVEIGTRSFIMVFDKYRGGKLVAVKSNNDVTDFANPLEKPIDQQFYYMDPLGLSAELFVAEMQLEDGINFNPDGASTATITIPYSGGLSEMNIQPVAQ